MLTFIDLQCELVKRASLYQEPSCVMDIIECAQTFTDLVQVLKVSEHDLLKEYLFNQLKYVIVWKDGDTK